jgi:hypothetical protein
MDVKNPLCQCFESLFAFEQLDWWNRHDHHTVIISHSPRMPCCVFFTRAARFIDLKQSYELLCIASNGDDPNGGHLETDGSLLGSLELQSHCLTCYAHNISDRKASS